MFSRRTVLKAGTTTLVSLGVMRQLSVLADESTPASVDQDMGMLFHQNLPTLPEASTGEIEVVLMGNVNSQLAGMLIHNASEETVGIDHVTGVARREDGSELGTIGGTVIAPYVLNPGEYAVGVIRFEDAPPAEEELEFQFDVETEVPGTNQFEQVDVPVTEMNIDGGQFEGIIENNTDLIASELGAVVGLFFDEEGEITGWFYRWLALDVHPGETWNFRSRDVFGEITDSWAIAASGPAG